MASNVKLINVNNSMYFFASPFARVVYSLNVIKLAREDISVPTPPMFTPTNNGRQSAENFDSKMAEGTLLMH